MKKESYHLHKALVLFSGGQDSTTCLYWAKKNFKEVQALSIFYGQRHEREITSAQRISRLANVNLKMVDLQNLFSFCSDSALLTDQNISENHRSGQLPASFVPGRNIVLLTAAAMLAFKQGINHIVTGVCQTDYSGYPDCREETIKSLETTLCRGMEYDFKIHTPLMHLTKAETVKMASTLDGCWEALSHSHTCYEGKVPPCGKCPACELRAKGFKESGYADPLIRRLNG